MLPPLPANAEVPAVTDQDPQDLQLGFQVFNAWMGAYGTAAKSLFLYATKAHAYCAAQMNSQGASQ